MLKIKFQGDGENVFTLLFYFGMDYFTCGTIFVPHVFIHGWIHRVVLGDFNNLFTVRNSAHTSNVDVARVFYVYWNINVQGVWAHTYHTHNAHLMWCGFMVVY